MHYETFVRQFKLSLCLASLVWAINPLEEWSKPAVQHLVTRSTPAAVTPQPQESTHYEDIVVFSLKAVIAAFHVDPKHFMEDRNHLSKYFNNQAMNQVDQALFPGSGSGLLDHCLLQQTYCDAIARKPLTIEENHPHFIQVRLPIITQSEEKVDVILSLKQTPTYFEITNFTLEIPNE